MKKVSSNSFVRWTGDEDNEEGFTFGDLFYIIKFQMVGEDKKDPYLQRMLILTHKHLDKGELDVENVYVCDPRDFKPATKRDNKKFMKLLEKHYS